MAATATIPLPTVRFQVNVPETIVLVHPEGRAVRSNYGGDQVMYTLTDGRRMYVDPYVAEKIRQLGIRPSQPFTICKREQLHGNRRVVDFEVSLPGAAESRQTAAPAPVAAPMPQSQHSHVNAPHASAPAPITISINIDQHAVALLKASGVAAIDAILEVEQYARSRGMADFAFGAENAQKVWGTIFIELARKGVRA